MSSVDSKSKAYDYWRTMVEEDRAECAPGPDESEIVERPIAALALLLCPTQRDAVDSAIALTEAALSDSPDRPYPDLAQMQTVFASGVDRKLRSEACRVIAADLEAIGGPRASEAALCWWMLAASPRDPETCAVAVDLEQLARRVRWPEKDAEIRQRVRVWLDAHAGEYEHDDRDLFAIAEAEVSQASATKDSTTMRKVYDGVPLSVLLCDDETAAVDLVVHYTSKVAGMTGAKLPAVLSVSSTPPKDGDRRAWWRTECRRMSSELTDRADDGLAGAAALCWRMLAVDPAKTRTFLPVLPALTYLADRCDWSADKKAKLQARLKIWLLAASGEYGRDKRDMFEIAAQQSEALRDDEMNDSVVEELCNRASAAWSRRKVRLPSSPRPRPAPDGPAVVVMIEAPVEKKHLQDVWKRLDGADVPLIVCRDAYAVRCALEAEYPHARAAVATLTQDLRDGEPVRTRPMLLVGPPGSGKSRLVRRLAELLGVYVYRVDATAAADGFFAGTNRSWHSSAPSVPARAIAASMRANPLVMVDEIEKAAESTMNGNLWNAMTPFLERETSQRYRDVGLDAELDLSHVNHVATANSVERLPSFLRDRFRLIRVPAPTLAHLPALAALVLQDIKRDDDARAGAPPLAPDELDCIGQAWVREKFSMRKLARLVEATLEARDACAPRH